jgi:hypothetical protein
MVGIPMVVLMYGAALFGLGLTPTDRAILSGLWSQVRARIV